MSGEEKVCYCPRCRFEKKCLICNSNKCPKCGTYMMEK